MQCYTELTPPTGVTHSLSIAFTSARSSNLVVAKSSLLQIFATKTIPADLDVHGDASSTAQAPYAPGTDSDEGGLDASFLGGDSALIRSDKGLLTKLVMVAEFSLAGTVTGLARIKIAGTRSGGDALLLAFKDARLSLVEWDPESNDLSTISIHYYEQDELQGAPWAAPLSDYHNYLVADPGSRCAALKFGARSLAILPFRQSDDDDEEGADIDMEDEWDEELDGPRPAKAANGGAATAVVTGPGTDIKTIEDTPFSPSFVLRLSNLDPNLLHPVHLSFLHEYREPTFGILSSSMSPSSVLGRKDCLSYMVFTLDLQQKASTTILSVSNLPQDLFRVFAIPSPVGGALLIGNNELIHIDQSSRNGVAVNPFAKQSTSFSLADQSELDLRLEGANIEVISAETGELLLVLNDGRAAIVTLVLDGRAVSGVKVAMVQKEAGGELLLSDVASLSRVGRQTLFIGSENSDSVVLGWSRKQTQSNRRKSKLVDEFLDDDPEEVEEMEEDDDDDDDLYGDGPSVLLDTANGSSKSASAGGGELSFRIHDRLISIAPIRDMTYGRPPPLTSESASRSSEKKIRSDLSLVCAVGRSRGGALALLNREINPEPIGVFDFPEAQAMWTVCASKPIPKSIQGEKSGATIGDDYESPVQFDKFMIVAKEDEEGFETSDVYALTGTGFEKLTGTEFEPAAGLTVQAGTMGKHTRIIQVLKSEVRCYDGDLGLSQILPMIDEETDAELKILSASIADPYILLIRDDNSAFVAEINKDYELEEIEREEGTLTSTKWVTGCLYNDTTGTFAAPPSPGADNILMFLYSETGQFHIYSLPALKLVYAADGLGHTPQVLSTDYTTRRGTTKEQLAEVLVAELGDSVEKSPYLILRHANNDITIYQPIHAPTSASPAANAAASLRFLKSLNNTFAKASSQDEGEDTVPESQTMPLRICNNIGGYSTVFVPGSSPSFILKSAKSSPKVIGLQGASVRSLSPFHTQGCERGFIYVDVEGTSRVCSLPAKTNLTELGVTVRKVPLNVDSSGVAYHPPTAVYAVGASTLESFELPKDESHRSDWAKESIAFKPQFERGKLLLISPVSWSIIDTVEMESCEVIMCVKTLNLEVSESTNERKQLITVGTAISRGEDLAVRGRVYVFDVVSVIPEPGRPETNHKLKLVAKEDIPRGAVTAISEIGTQGLMLVAQGQKCLVRGLKEDGTLLPVAFMDMNCYVTSAKELPGTGLCVMADAFKGVWFTGYTEEPYKMILFGKSNTRLEAINVDLLPDGKELFIVAADPEGNLHVLQFDPDHPKSLQGHLLLHRATFCTGAHFTTSSLLMPSTPAGGHRYDEKNGANGDGDQPAAPNPQHLVLASPTGMLASLVPISESEYRRLSSLAGQLANSLTHTAGLNPRGYRMAIEGGTGASTLSPGVDTAVGRSIVDGALLARWTELGSGRKSEIAGRVGFASPLDVRGALEGVLGWSRMSYF
ncbi:cleavage and polyadenylation specificity factor subunit [Ophiostoma piceae UAMH 11346]|uniref:Protein CFT1 n=1 Tax=Ophiostoma piceae (strain UAMH 11346) TaxID=1262450 RepID=S3D0D5_OPHP1|nr:cleavage and polyadenylation specificity factor subunit [Ophiostoma piceae UAMH 11346]